MSLTDEQIELHAFNDDPGDWDDLAHRKTWREGYVIGYRAAESAATAPLLERIEELERKSDQDDETIVWQAGQIGQHLDRIKELEAARFAYASEFGLDEEGQPDKGSIHQNIRALKAKCAELEALRKDAERYRWLRSAPNGFEAQRIVNDTPEGMDAAIDASKEQV